MSFIWIEMLWLLFLVPILAGAYFLIQRRRKKYALRYASLSLVKDAMGRGSRIRRHIPPIIFLLSMTIILVALARPAATITLPSQQGTVILTFDVSGSMRAEDIRPTRLEAAKSAALKFVEKQPRNVRIGVVSFSDNAAVVQAPTTDREAINGAINRLKAQRATGIGRGIITSLEAIFEEPSTKSAQSSRDPLGLPDPSPSPAPLPPGTYAPAVIVLLSDGQSNVGPRPLEVIEQAANRGVRVYTVGMGSPEGIVLNFEGRSVRVRLDEDTLKRMAEKTDGRYYRASNETDLSKIYETLGSQIVFKIEQTELTAWFTGFAALLLIVAGLLSLLWFNRLL